MSEHDKNLTLEEQQALEALAQLRPARASDVAKARARTAFLQGDDTVDEAPALPKRGAIVAMWLPLAAAAAILVMLFLYGTRPVDKWQVSDLVEADGVEFDSGDLALGAKLGGGVIETGPGSEIELVLGDDLRVRVIGNSRVFLPSPPGRWFERDTEFFVEAGEVYGTSGGTSPDFPVTLATDEAEALLTGTTFAAFRTEEHTCFCLFEGGMDITLRDVAFSLPLEVGKRIFVYRDGKPFLVQPLDAMETMKLQMMQDAGAPQSD